MRRSANLYLWWTVIFLQSPLNAQEEFPDLLFYTNTVLEITVETDLQALVNDIAYERDYHRAVISYLNDHGFDEMIPLKIKTRGNFRRGRDNCDFPPFLLNFPKKWTIGTIFEDRNKLKLVTHCVTAEPSYQDYILKEFLVYRLLNQITDYSFKVRLTKITYLDSEDTMESMVHFGFIIEDNKSLGQRIGGKSSRVVLTTRKNPDYHLSTMMSLFQFMVGNTDWFLPDHNVQIFSLEDGRDTVAIPYDFDLTGFVNPHYTRQYKNYELASPRERHYLGFCRSHAELKPVLDQFLHKTQEVIQVVSDFDYLDGPAKLDCMDYLHEFYDLLQSSQNIMEAVNASCSDEF